jgi:hypothetical protein
VRKDRLLRDRLPLATGGERGAAAADELRLQRLAQDALGTERERGAERGVAAVGEVRVEARRVRAADAGEEDEGVASRVPASGERTGSPNRSSARSRESRGP